MRQLAENLWLLQFPLQLLGCRLGRNVAVMRLDSGQLVIHSTAAFSTDDLAAMRALGTPAWLLDATLFHDSCVKSARAALPELPYLAPPGFPASLGNAPLLPPPPEWSGEIDVVELQGMPKVREHAFFHRPSATLIVADLLFNLAATGWTRAFMRGVAGLKNYPGMSRFFRFMIKDLEAFRGSIEQLRTMPFERIIVGHGEPITKNARQVFDDALAKHGY